MKIHWKPFVASAGDRQPLPPPGVFVLVQIAADSGPPPVAVGYLKMAGFDQDAPVWAVPGMRGDVVAWCDCLPSAFTVPVWALGGPAGYAPSA